MRHGTFEGCFEKLQVEITKWLICMMIEIWDDDVQIVFVMLVTFIVLKLDITFDDSDKEYIKKIKATHQLNVDALSKMKKIEKVENGGWRLLKVKGSV